MAHKKSGSPSKTRSRSAKRRLGRGLGSLLNTPVDVDAGVVAPHNSPAAELPDTSAEEPPVVAAAVQEPASDPDDTLSPLEDVEPTPPSSQADGPDGERLYAIPLDKIEPGRHQPRQDFDENALDALACSIRSAGVMQPIVVRTPGPNGMYELVAGERRWRAAEKAGLTTIPAVVRDLDERTAAELSVIENLQREDLNPVERAVAFKRLIEEFEFTQQELAERVGLNRASISNHLRLLDLDMTCQDALRTGLLSFGHARALLSIASIDVRVNVMEQAVRDGWSVRAIEKEARRIVELSVHAASVEFGTETAPETSKNDQTAAEPELDGIEAHMKDLQRRLGEHLGTRVEIKSEKGTSKGRITIDFYDLPQFEGLMERFQFELTS